MMKQKMTHKLLLPLIALMVSLAAACSPDDGGSGTSFVPSGTVIELTSVALYAEDATVAFGGSTMLTATLLDQNDDPYVDEDLEVTFVVDGYPSGTSLSTDTATTANGTASVTIMAGYEAGTFSVHANVGELSSDTLDIVIGDSGSTGDDDDDDVTTCVDNDGDSYGDGCAAGTDCDDTDNSIHTGCTTVGPPATLLVSLDPASGQVQLEQSVTIQVAVSDSSGFDVANGTTVNFTINNASFGNLSSTTCGTLGGECAITFTAGSSASLINTSATMTATAGAISTNFTLTIVPTGLADEIVLTTSPSPANISEGETVTIKAKLFSDGDVAMNNEVIELSTSPAGYGYFLQGGVTPVSSLNLVTNSSGEVTITWRSEMDQIGQATITAEVQGGNNPVATSSIIISPLPDVPTTLTMSVYPNEITIGGSATVDVEVFNQFSDPIADGTLVEFSTNFAGVTLTAQANTVNGIASSTFIAAENDTPSLPGTAQINVTAGNLFAYDYLKINDADLSSIVFSSADPAKIGVKGSGLVSTSILKFEVFNDRGQPVRDGIKVNFTLYGPNGGETIDPVEASTVNGIATTFLDAGVVAGAVRVDAKATYVDNFGVTHQLKTSTSNVAIVAGPPSARSFGMAIDTHNRLGQSYNNEEWIITAFMADRFSNFVPVGTSVSFYSEAGAIGPSGSNEGLTNEEGEATILAQSEDPRPIDVGRNYIDNLYSPIYRNSTYFPDVWTPSYWAYHNPRDNWNTIIATTIGEERFDDANANGIYDAGEYFVDMPEPFIDSNDNNVWDDAEDWDDDNGNDKWDSGDPFYDLNNNGTRDTCVEEPYTDLDIVDVFNGSYDLGEPFSDINSNGVWDACVAEPFDDYYPPAGYTPAETFYDEDGNGLYDEAEFFVDYNQNGIFDGPNGEWDSDTMIWTKAITNWSSLPLMDILYEEDTTGTTNGYFVDVPNFAVSYMPDFTNAVNCPANQDSGSTNWCDPDRLSETIKVRVSDLNGGPLPPDSQINVSLDSGDCTVGVGWDGTKLIDSIIGNTDFTIPIIHEPDDMSGANCVRPIMEIIAVKISVSVPTANGTYEAEYSINGEVHCEKPIACPE